MEQTTTITIDPTNSLAAMAFVLADQQRIIKQQQEENACFHKELQEMIDIDNQQYKDLETQYHKLQDQYDSYTKDFNSQVIELNRIHQEKLMTLESANVDLTNKWQEAIKKVDSLEDQNARLSEQVSSIPVWKPCSVATDENGMKFLAGFDKDGCVLISFIVPKESFYDYFDRKCVPGSVAYRGVYVSKGVVTDAYVLDMIDFNCGVNYLPIQDFISYEDFPDLQSE